MVRRRRRQQAHDRMQRFAELPPEQAGLIMSVSLGNALVSVGLQVVLLAACIGAARRAVRARHGGIRSTADAALTRPVVGLACVTGLHLVLTKLLLPRWTDRAMGSREHARPHEDQPPTP